MKKIYQIVFVFSVLFFVVNQENIVLGQTDSELANITSLFGKISLCSIQTDSTNQIVNDTTKIIQIRYYGCRAVSTVTTDKPLYIVDGIPQDGDSVLIKITPDDIESISVLKGAVATAIWGSRGANGVILITLKKEEKIVVEEEVIVKIEDISINVFPNPTSESVNIALNLKEKSVVQINMYNLQTLESYEVSKEVYEAGEQKINWKVDSLKKGTYNIKIKIANQIIDRKVVIQ